MESEVIECAAVLLILLDWTYVKLLSLPGQTWFEPAEQMLEVCVCVCVCVFYFILFYYS